MVTIKSKREIELMREAGRVTALTHKAIEESNYKNHNNIFKGNRD